MRVKATMLLLLLVPGQLHSQSNQSGQQPADERNIPLILVGRPADHAAELWSRSGLLVPGADGLPSYREASVAADFLAASMSDLVGSLQPALDELSSLTGDFAIEQIEMDVGINSEGKIGVWFAEGSVGTQAGIRLIFRRSGQNTSGTTP